jgi:hypothetical protein
LLRHIESSIEFDNLDRFSSPLYPSVTGHVSRYQDSKLYPVFVIAHTTLPYWIGMYIVALLQDSLLTSVLVSFTVFLITQSFLWISLILRDIPTPLQSYSCRSPLWGYRRMYLDNPIHNKLLMRYCGSATEVDCTSPFSSSGFANIINDFHVWYSHSFMSFLIDLFSAFIYCICWSRVTSVN